MRGASSPTRSAADLRMGDEYVLRALRSGLRDKIFREFVGSYLYQDFTPAYHF